MKVIRGWSTHPVLPWASWHFPKGGPLNDISTGWPA